MSQSIRPGDVLADRYRLVDLLSESGGGRFWRAHDRVLQRHVALHVIGEDDERAEGLIEAARRSATVPDRRVLRVLDAERVGGLCYVVNEWGSGTSLDILVTAHGPLPPRRAAWLVSEVADSVARAHAAGICHGRLVPENVLVDRTGAVRLIGLAVDAALHGLPPDRQAEDVTDLAGLVYCAITGRWAGGSPSSVPAAPRDHGRVLRPRQVRAGVPRPLDALCDEVLNPYAAGRARAGAPDSARAIADLLADFVGDPTGLPEQLAAANAHRRPETVVLPPVPEILLRDPDDEALPAPAGAEAPDPGPDPAEAPDPEPDPAAAAAPEAGDPAPEDTEETAGPAPDADPADATPTGELPATEAVPVGTDRPQGPPPAVEELPTQPGMPALDEDDAWYAARATPAPPPPPFEAPPERPLFAPEPADGGPARRPREDRPARPRGDGEYWPWDTGTGRGTGTGLSAIVDPDDPDGPDDQEMPGRRWLRLAAGIGAGLLLLMAVVVAFNLGRGKTPLGTEPEPEPSTTAPTARAEPTPLTGLTATDLDPQGDDGGENPETVGQAVDGDPATTWRTLTYLQQFGPGGLKTGVGLVLDLGGEQQVAEVVMELVGQPTGLELYLTDSAPTDVSDLQPVETRTVDGDARIMLEEPTPATHVTIWLTSLPAVDGGFRGEVAEVTVRG